MTNRFRTWTLPALSLCAMGAAQAFQDRPVTMIVPFGAATAVDLQARDFAQALGSVLGQSVIVDNRPGAEGAIGAMAVLNARADGQTIMFTSSSIPVLDPVMKKSMQYDPVKDFVPVCILGSTSNVINITGASAIKSAVDLIAAAKAQPGRLTFAYSSASTRLAGELFQQAAGVKFTGVPYKASSTGLADVASGQVDLFFIDDVSASAFYQNHRLRPLAVAGPERIRALPDTPSASEIGVPAYDIRPWFGVYLSAKTAPELVRQWRELMLKAMDSPIAKANMEKRGLAPIRVCGDAMAKTQANETALWREVTSKAGIEPQ